MERASLVVLLIVLLLLQLPLIYTSLQKDTEQPSAQAESTEPQDSDWDTVIEMKIDVCTNSECHVLDLKR